MKANVICSILVAAAALVVLQSASAQTMPPADNTKSNQTDSSNRDVTADTQKEKDTDRGLVQRIRKSLMANKDLSTYAHNVKVVSINGQVTTNGIVRSDDERTKVVDLAQQVAGKQPVVNDLKVAPPKSLAQLMRYYWDTIAACVPPARIMKSLKAAGFIEGPARVVGRFFRVSGQ